MKEVYIFNPQNDLALATGGINYVAPPFAVQMATDLAVLPAYIAKPDSLLITDSDLDAQWLDHLNSTFALDVHAIKRSQLRGISDYRIMPWGWCLDLRRRLIKWGAGRDSVPSKDAIYYMRGLSHRRITVLIHLRLQELLGRQLCPIPVELAVPDEVMAFASSHRECYIKTPWSSSGRGIYHNTGKPTPELELWCRGALKRQGSVLCEEALDKVMDFAVEFYSSQGKVKTRGYSIFTTDAHSQYAHGDVAPSQVLKKRITELYPQFDEVVAATTQVLNELVAPYYSGWLGVDMLLFNKKSTASNSPSKIDQWCKPNAEACENSPSKIEGVGGSMILRCSPLTLEEGVKGEYDIAQNRKHSLQIDPCVELNLRPTMGAITSVLGDTILALDTTASFVIEQRRSTNDPWPKHTEPVIEDHRLRSGTLILTPPTPTALYRAILTAHTT